MKLPILLAIDPSVRSLGYAIVDLNKAEGSDWYDISNRELWDYGIVQMKSTKQIDPSLVKYRWLEAYINIKSTFEQDGKWPTYFASEWPTYFNSEKGRLAAQQNYTLGIASMVGYIAGQFGFHPNNVALWTPAQWKGSVPKHITNHKFVKTFGQPAERLSRILSDDVIDAIMIARYWLSIYDRQLFRWQKVTKQENLELTF